MMTTYYKLVNGEQIEISELQMRREKLGLPEEMPEAEVNAAWDAFQAGLAAEQNAEALQQSILAAAAQRLAAFDPNAVPSLFDNIEDPETRLALAAINGLIADIRTIVMAVLG